MLRILISQTFIIALFNTFLRISASSQVSDADALGIAIDYVPALSGNETIDDNSTNVTTTPSLTTTTIVTTTILPNSTEGSTTPKKRKTGKPLQNVSFDDPSGHADHGEKKPVSIVVAPRGRTLRIRSKSDDSTGEIKTALGDAFNALNSITSPSNGIMIDELFVDYESLCEAGPPYMIGVALAYCTSKEAGQCPETYWCHIGSSRITTYCCPGSKGDSGCEQDLNVGFGSSQMSRWYYDRVTRGCLRFRYNGYGGNENNFLTLQDCEKTCTSQSTGSPSLHKQQQQQRPPESPPTVQPAHPCLQEAGVYGSGSATIIRYYYNVNQGRCASFEWSGQGGTQNNFPTIAECEARCRVGTSPSPALLGRPVISNPCVLPSDQGQGNSPAQRWYFDISVEQCRQFSFLGQGGNANSFQTQQECQDVCGATVRVDPSVCTRPQNIGRGAYLIPRWSYNQATSQCSAFFYSGCCGNDNRFTTQSQCIQACQQPILQQPTMPPFTMAPTFPPFTFPTTPFIPVFPTLPQPILQPPVTPCQGGSVPATQLQFCGQNTGFQCGAGTFCHVGSGTTTTVCCPVLPGNPCSQPQTRGTGTDQLQRYWYNSATQRCESFLYSGLQGNQNNFQTYDQCTTSCAANPCGSGTPYTVNGQPIQCGFLQQNICPSNYYCHIGADTVTTTCCPRTGENRCNLPIIRGTGQASLQRWDFNAVSRRCEAFIYSGMGGNENNFLSEADCLGSCPVADNPCLTGSPGTGQGTTAVTFCSTASMNVCPQGFYCHVGAGPTSTLCCQTNGPNPCNLPLATGTGNAILSRWYFDAASSSCRAFTYTGIKGNENNFLTLADCRRTCPEFDNPCPRGSPPFNPQSGQVAFCSITSTNCPADHWCHIGANRQTSVCCPFASAPCTQPRTQGNGNSQLPRYFYDQTNRICDQFSYSGKGGNQNNFLSKAECEAACPVLDNPCADGMPAITATGTPLLCSTVNPDICPPTYWCHIGFSAASTLCCPGAADPCRMPLARGSGTAVLNRWYYNTDTKTCLSYTYTGRNGNQNNFISLAECRLRCPEFQNPCSTGQPHIGLNGQITRCGATTPSICPTTYWCHVGATLDTSVCCPGAGNPCELPLAVGNGNANLFRSYYDRASQLCRPFQYTGMGGNENNFMVQQDCEKRCPVFRNPCSTGDPARNIQGQVIPCSVSNLDSCPASYWCHIGSDEQTTLCCPGATNPCREPLQVGTGSAALPRHYYNSLTQQCLPFTYSGIGGTMNNFLSRADCERTCPVFANPCGAGDPATGPNGQFVLCTATSPNICPANFWCHIGDLNQNSVCCPGADNPCILPVATGNGNAALPRWYFDTNVRRCTRFTYTGMGGNQDNFLSLSDCQLRCPEFQTPCATGDPAQSPLGGILFCSSQATTCPATYWCHVGADSENTVCCPGASDPCLQSMVPGAGSNKLPRWYFNQSTRQCLEFTYTGKSGNQNNFLSEAECVRRCPVFQNPCTSTMMPPTVAYCSAQNTNVCPSGYWCHVGRSPETSVCCPGSADPCSLPQVIGTGAGIGPMNRWYFDTTSRLCKLFSYSGLGGNQNNFQTQTECQQKCPEFVNPCLSGTPYQEQNTGLVRYCNRNLPTDCPQAFWCHVGATQQSTVCCPGQGDPCTLPIAVGSGPASMPRWYFSTQSRQCLQFTYTGLAGNQNNFLSQRDCQQACPEFSNPCASGTPLTSLAGQVTYCSQQNPNICPTSYFCHFGAVQESTVCCPTIGDACNLPRQIGVGSASLQRWYFNSLTRKCEGFVYTGLGGNANSFLTLESCRARCPEFSNPCVGSPYTSAGGQILYCNTGSVCPPNYFCHFGQDSTTTMCCPSSGDPCSLPVVIGPGSAQLTRYYYNAVLRSCVSFVYSGLGGNENNFRGSGECQGRCQPLANPCTPGQQPFQDATGRNLQCGTPTGVSSSSCPANYFCHVGVDVWNTVCCPMQATTRCDPNPAEGAGDANLQRWYYNRFTGQCQLFTYRGIAGNANNFLTQQECSQICTMTPIQQPLFQPTMPQPLPTLPQLPFIPTPSICPQGDALQAQSGLPQTCAIQSPSCPSTYVCNMNTVSGSACCPDPKYFCLQPRFGGGASARCKASPSMKYGYDPNSDTCVPFQYNGCQGNLNNFGSQEHCTKICCNKGYNRLFLERADAAALAAAHRDASETGAAAARQSPTKGRLRRFAEETLERLSNLLPLW